MRKNTRYYDPAVAFVSVYECSRDELCSGVSLDSSTWADGGIDSPDGNDDGDIADALEELEVIEQTEYKSNSALRKQKAQESDDQSRVSAPKLRTSADVYNRLMWDPEYDASDYLIGYEDRFDGVKETLITNWSREVEDESFVSHSRDLVHPQTVLTLLRYPRFLSTVSFIFVRNQQARRSGIGMFSSLDGRTCPDR